MVVVTLGNMVGGALLLAWPLRKMSADNNMSKALYIAEKPSVDRNSQKL